MKPKNLLTVILGSAVLAAPSFSQAHFLWISQDPTAKTASVGFQEVPEQSPLSLGNRAEQVKAWLLGGEPLALKADETWLRAPVTDAAVAASLDYGVIDRRDAGRGVFWLRYYAKGAATLTASQTHFHLPVELSAADDADGVRVVTVWRSGKPAPGADVVVEDATGKQTFAGKTGADGTVVFPKASGPLEVRALITDTRSGTEKGKPYELIRSYGTLRVTDPSAAAQKGPVANDFRRVVVWDGGAHDKGSTWVNPTTSTFARTRENAENGTTALEFKFHDKNAWLGCGFDWNDWKAGRDVGTDTSNMTNLTFRVKTKGVAGDLQLQLLCNGDVIDTPEHHAPKVSVVKYCPNFRDGNWHDVVIPLADMPYPKGFDPKVVTMIDFGFWSDGASDGSMLIEDLAFDNRPLTKSRSQ